MEYMEIIYSFVGLVILIVVLLVILVMEDS